MSLNRYNPKRDHNEPAIRAILKKHGVMSWPLSDEGIPDLLCCWGGRYFLIEVKASDKAPLTKEQQVFFAYARHHNSDAYVCWDTDSVLMALERQKDPMR